MQIQEERIESAKIRVEEPKTKVAPLKIVESDAMRKARSGAEMVSGSQKSLPLDGLERPYELPALSILNYEAPNNERVSRDVLLENAAVLHLLLKSDFKKLVA